jgi:hypothetical protein
VAAVFQTTASFAVAALFFYEGVRGYPFPVPVQELLTGNAFKMYLLLPGFTAFLTVCSYKTLMWASSPRTRMLSRLYKLSTLLGGLAMVGSAWLLFVLRHSIDTGSGDEWSASSQVIIMEAIILPYAGVAMMLWCWGTWRGEARRRACSIIARPLFLWVPSATWPLVVAAVSDDRHVLDRMPLFWPLGSLSFSLIGFVFEIAWFFWNRQPGWATPAQTFAAICTSVLVSGSLLAFNWRMSQLAE